MCAYFICLENVILGWVQVETYNNINDGVVRTRYYYLPFSFMRSSRNFSCRSNFNASPTISFTIIPICRGCWHGANWILQCELNGTMGWSLHSGAKMPIIYRAVHLERNYIGGYLTRVIDRDRLLDED